MVRNKALKSNCIRVITVNQLEFHDCGKSVDLSFIYKHSFLIINFYESVYDCM